MQDDFDVIDKVIDDNQILLNDINKYTLYMDNIIKEQCLINDIEIKDINPSTFIYILSYIGDTVYKNNYQLIKKDSNKNDYDLDKVKLAFKVLVRLSYKYSVDINKSSFCLFIGIDGQTLWNWVSAQRIDFAKMLDEVREDLLTSMLIDRKRSGISVVAMLNHLYSWATPRQRGTESESVRITAKDMPKLGIGENKTAKYARQISFENAESKQFQGFEGSEE